MREIPGGFPCRFFWGYPDSHKRLGKPPCSNSTSTLWWTNSLQLKMVIYIYLEWIFPQKNVIFHCYVSSTKGILYIYSIVISISNITIWLFNNPIINHIRCCWVISHVFTLWTNMSLNSIIYKWTIFHSYCGWLRNPAPVDTVDGLFHYL